MAVVCEVCRFGGMLNLGRRFMSPPAHGRPRQVCSVAKGSAR